MNLLKLLSCEFSGMGIISQKKQTKKLFLCIYHQENKTQRLSQGRELSFIHCNTCILFLVDCLCFFDFVCFGFLFVVVVVAVLVCVCVCVWPRYTAYGILVSD